MDDGFVKAADQHWEELDYDERLSVFYSVMKRLHKAELEDRGSYRYALYDVFGFDADAYILGMDCGFMEIHNVLHQGLESIYGEDYWNKNEKSED